jgi:hypothetical protein
MKRLLSRLLKWKSDDANPPKRVASAHEIAIRHGATRERQDRAPEVPAGNVAHGDMPVAPVAPEERRRRKRQGQRLAKAKMAAPVTPAADEPGKEGRRRRKGEARRAQGVEDVKPRRKPKKRREGTSYI